VHSGGTTTWTLPYTDPGIDAIVLGPAFGSSAGTILTPASVVSNTVTASGNYSAGVAALGRRYTASVVFSRPYVRDQNGRAEADAYITIRKLTAFYTRSGSFNIKSTQTSRAARTKTFEAALGLRSDGELEAWLNGNTRTIEHFIDSTSPRPFTVNGIQYDLDYSTRSG